MNYVPATQYQKHVDILLSRLKDRREWHQDYI